MKKLKYLLILTILLIPISGRASMHCSAPSSVESGETFGVTFYGSIGGPAPIWFAKLAGEGNATYSSGSLTVGGEETSNFSRTVYYTAGNPGTAKFYAYDVDVASENDSFSSSDTCTVTITEATKPNGVGANIYDATNNNSSNSQTETDPDKSSNSYLKSLSIEGIKISPAFNKDRMEYIAVVPGDKDKITIKGELEDDKAKVEGLGEVTLKEGINRFEIKVTAENTEERKYVITVSKKEKNPIEITIDKKKYTVVKKEVGLKVPEGFIKTTVVINKEDVVAYSNSFTGYLIVALVDEQGNASWFIYNQNNGTYTKYSEFKSNGLRLIILDAKKKDVPYKYKKCKVDINGEIVDGYALQLGSDYRLVYALNMDSGEKAFYLYDTKDNTFQRFYNTQVEIYRDLLKKLEIGIIGLAAVIAILIVIIISISIINKKTKKIIKNGRKVKEETPLTDDEEDEEEKKEELKKQIKEKSNEIDRERIELEKTKRIKQLTEEKDDNEEEEKPLTREEIKRRRKEEKAELERMRRDFFDL